VIERATLSGDAGFLLYFISNLPNLNTGNKVDAQLSSLGGTGEHMRVM
jgi:hypothetical protein